MKLAIMQPYFFPYLGYFQLIKSVDRFIFFDDVQYIRHGWINRNRILKPSEGWQYITVPLQKHGQVDLIKNISLINTSDWKKKIIRQLEHYKKKADYYEQTIELVNLCFSTDEISIVKFNARCIEIITNFLKIPFKMEISSEMDFDYSNVKDAGDWALHICEQLNAKEYINPKGGAELFDENKFRSSNINLSFLSPHITPYDQKRSFFEPGLSIIDVLMFNGIQQTKEMINKFEIIIHD